MIDFKKLRIGDKIFHIEEEFNSFSRKKIVMVDQEGLEWYRYDKQLRVYSIKEYACVGKCTPVIAGKVIAEEVNDMMYFIENEKGMDYLTPENNANSDYWFSSEEEAKIEITRKQEVQAKIDRS